MKLYCLSAILAAVFLQTPTVSGSSTCKVGIGATKSGGYNETSTNGQKHNIAIDLDPSCQNGSIEIELSNGAIKIFANMNKGAKQGRARRNRARRATEGSSPGESWYGQSSDGSEFNYVCDSNGNIFGSIVDTTDASVTQIRLDSDGSPIAVTIPASQFPAETEPVINHDRDLEAESTINSNSNLLRGISSQIRTQHDRSLYNDEGGNLDVMIIWTRRAECVAAGRGKYCIVDDVSTANMKGIIDLAVEETNAAYSLSGVDTELLLVHSYMLRDYVEASSRAFNTALKHISSMADIRTERSYCGADLVALIIDDSQSCGIAYVGPSARRMFSVTAWNCATGYYSFGHEIAHNLGCEHDRGQKDSCTSDLGNYNYGYRDPNGAFRTILAYNCNTDQCDTNPSSSCVRIQRFSTPDPAYTYNGKAIGTCLSDNARRINEVKAAVAGYYPHTTRRDRE